MNNPHSGKIFRIQEGPPLTVAQLTEILAGLPRKYKVHIAIEGQVSTTRQVVCNDKAKLIVIQ